MLKKVVNQLLFGDGHAVTTGWLVAEKALRMITGVLFNTVFIKAIGAGLNADYGGGLLMASIIYPLFTLGLNEILIYRFSHTDEPGKVLGASLGLRLISGTIITILFLLYALGIKGSHYWDQHYYFTTCLFSQLLMYIIQSLDGADYYFQQQGKIRPMIAIRLLLMVVFTVGRIALISPERGMLDAVILYSIPAEVLLGYLIYWLYSPNFRTLISAISFDGKLIASFFDSNKSLVLLSLLVNAMRKLDQLAIKYFIGSEAIAGIYFGAVRYSEPWQIVPVIITNSYSGKFYAMHKQDPKAANQFWLGVGGLNMAFSLVVIIATLLAGPILEMYLGQSYSGVTQILSIHIITLIFSAAGSVGWHWLAANQLNHHVIWRMALSILFFAISSLVLFPLLYVAGLAISMVLTMAFVYLLTNLLNKSTRPLFNLQVEAFRYMGLKHLVQTLKSR